MKKEEKYPLTKYRGFLWQHIRKYKLLMDEEDVYQELSMAFLKAVRTFDDSKGYAFMTYLGRILTNEILMIYRKEKKLRENMAFFSLDSLVRNGAANGDDGGGEEQLNLIPAGGRHPYDGSDMKRIIKILKNHPDWDIMVDVYYGLKQREIAEKHDISQSYVSRLVLSYRKEMKQRLEAVGLYDYIRGGLGD